MRFELTRPFRQRGRLCIQLRFLAVEPFRLRAEPFLFGRCQPQRGFPFPRVALQLLDTDIDVPRPCRRQALLLFNGGTASFEPDEVVLKLRAIAVDGDAFDLDLFLPRQEDGVALAERPFQLRQPLGFRRPSAFERLARLVEEVAVRRQELALAFQFGIELRSPPAELFFQQFATPLRLVLETLPLGDNVRLVLGPTLVPFRCECLPFRLEPGIGLAHRFQLLAQFLPSVLKLTQ